MPMIDAFIPEGALEPEAEARLMKEITEILLRHEEDIDPANELAQAVSVCFLHRPTVYVAGAPAKTPRYRFITSVPEGQYNGDAMMQSLVRGVTEAVARAEGGAFEEVSPRVWVFPNEVPEGRWGARGVIRRLHEILAFISGENASRAAKERLASRRTARALEVLATVLHAAGRNSSK